MEVKPKKKKILGNGNGQCRGGKTKPHLMHEQLGALLKYRRRNQPSIFMGGSGGDRSILNHWYPGMVQSGYVLLPYFKSRKPFLLFQAGRTISGSASGGGWSKTGQADCFPGETLCLRPQEAILRAGSGGQVAEQDVSAEHQQHGALPTGAHGQPQVGA